MTLKGKLAYKYANWCCENYLKLVFLIKFFTAFFISFAHDKDPVEKWSKCERKYW